MSEKEKQIREYETKRIIDELSKMPPMVIATAYLHAINYTLYGVEVTEKWQTATHNAVALERAYRKGYHEAIQAVWIPVSRRLPNPGEIILFSTETHRVFEGKYYADYTDREWYAFRDVVWVPNNTVRGWMPLPESYEAESEDEDE